MTERGILIIISGFSGSGKGTIVKELMRRYPEKYALSISATTRDPREGEVHGREYFFKTKEEFQAMIEAEELLEYACYVENYYGTPKDYVSEQLACGKNVILEIEIQGALKIREKFPETLLLFVMPPSAEVLYQRLSGRGTETADVIRSRMERAAEEADGCEAYDYLIINDDLSLCVEQVHSLILQERHRMIYNLDLVETFKAQLNDLSKGAKE